MFFLCWWFLFLLFIWCRNYPQIYLPDIYFVLLWAVDTPMSLWPPLRARLWVPFTLECCSAAAALKKVNAWLQYLLSRSAGVTAQTGFQSFTEVCSRVEDGQLRVQKSSHGCMAAQTGIQKHVLSDQPPPHGVIVILYSWHHKQRNLSSTRPTLGHICQTSCCTPPLSFYYSVWCKSGRTSVANCFINKQMDFSSRQVSTLILCRRS